jgi:hypothetical protein
MRRGGTAVFGVKLKADVALVTPPSAIPILSYPGVRSSMNSTAIQPNVVADQSHPEGGDA